MTEYTLHLGDCLEYMRGLPAGVFDAVVTDPPYGVDYRGELWDAFIPDWLGAARRLANVVVFTTAPTTQWDYPRPDWVNNWYRAGSPARTVSGGFCHWSPILIYGRVKFPVDTYVSSAALTGVRNKGIGHPSPKDAGMVRWLVRNASNPGDTIFDPFMGSGTTGVACMQLGRNFVGCEIDPEYFAIAEKRISEAAKQPPLFVADAPKEQPTQVELI